MMEELGRGCAFGSGGVKTTAAGCEGMRPTNQFNRNSRVTGWNLTEVLQRILYTLTIHRISVLGVQWKNACRSSGLMLF